MKIRKIAGGFTAAKGFKAASCEAAIKYQNRRDMALLFTDVPCAVAGTFTSNRVKAAPVLWDMGIVKSGKPARAVVVNTGIANAGTGKEGMRLCSETAKHTAEILGISADEVLVGSTGVIGPNVPLDRITAGVTAMAKNLSDSAEAGTLASKAIMTTDTVNMLGYLATDCAIDPSLLQKALSNVIKDTFNMITVDGDTSTNDTLLLFSSSLAGNKPITAEDESYELFCSALYSVCHDLSVLMASDGEGATHLLEIRVFNADTKENARTLARSVAGSSLVKAMIYGKDANCGRVLCALGYAGPAFDPANIVITMTGKSGSVCFYKDGCVQLFDEEKALAILSEHDVHFDCDMNMGDEEATAWGCDLTYDYVKINGDYRT